MDVGSMAQAVNLSMTSVTSFDVPVKLSTRNYSTNERSETNKSSSNLSSLVETIQKEHIEQIVGFAPLRFIKGCLGIREEDVENYSSLASMRTSKEEGRTESTVLDSLRRFHRVSDSSIRSNKEVARI